MLEIVLAALKKYINGNDITRENTPVGITISASGEWYYLKYSLNYVTGHSTIGSAIEEIKNFLIKKNAFSMETIENEQVANVS